MGDDPYEILGVPRDASARDISRAYKRRARKEHPDVNPGDRAAEERFKRISEAYALLSDPAKRAAYDRARSGLGGGAGIPWDGQDVSFTADAGVFQDLFSSLFGGGAGRRSPRATRQTAGRDIQTAVRIGFRDAILGLNAPLQVTRQIRCKTCGGSGRTARSSPEVCSSCGGSGKMRRAGNLHVTCRTCAGRGTTRGARCTRCAGRGYQSRSERIQVHIPAGVTNGTRLRVAQKGDDGPAGVPPGDLYVSVLVEKHPVFQRRGDNIYCKVPITVTEAALGARIEIPTVNGRARLNIPPGTQCGQQLRLRGRGAPSMRGGNRGDLLVEIQVMVPSVKDDETRRLFQELGRHAMRPVREELFRRAG